MVVKPGSGSNSLTMSLFFFPKNIELAISSSRLLAYFKCSCIILDPLENSPLFPQKSLCVVRTSSPSSNKVLNTKYLVFTNIQQIHSFLAYLIVPIVDLNIL